jgi:hypothetical protein
VLVEGKRRKEKKNKENLELHVCPCGSAISLKIRRRSKTVIYLTFMSSDSVGATMHSVNVYVHYCQD